MSDNFVDLDVLVLRKKEAHLKAAKDLDSDDLRQMLKDYKIQREQLLILKGKIESLIGEPLGATGTVAAEPSGAPRGRKKGGKTIQDSEVEHRVFEYLSDEPEGVSGSAIATELNGKFWKELSHSTVYAKVIKVLKADQKRETPRFRKEGELINSRWFSC
jgi:hypothetical protein